MPKANKKTISRILPCKIELTNEFGKIASDDFALLELEHVFLILEVDHGFEYLHCKVLILRLEVPHQIP